MIETYASVVTC